MKTKIKHKAQIETLKSTVKSLEGKVSQLSRDLVLMAERLKEARRRTIPYGNGRGEISILPICVKEIHTQRHMKETPSWDGQIHLSLQRVEATVVIEGDVTVL